LTLTPQELPLQICTLNQPVAPQDLAIEASILAPGHTAPIIDSIDLRAWNTPLLKYVDGAHDLAEIRPAAGKLTISGFEPGSFS